MLPINYLSQFADTNTMKRITMLLFVAIGITAFSSAQTPGFESFRQEGIASWYGREFDGRPTASGEIFNSALFTAAHPTLPFGTLLTVTNMQNNLQVTVRVNDRGPFVATRIIDLSMAAAEALDMLTVGTAPVIVERAFVAAAPAPVVVLTVPPTVTSPALPPATFPPAVAPPVIPATPPPAVVPPVIPATPPPAVAPPVIPATPPPAAVAPPVIPATFPPTAVAPPVIPATPPPAVQAVTPFPPALPAQQTVFPAPPAQLRGSVPEPGSTNLYRIQVGSYRVPRNAVESFERLRNSGLSPAYERSGDFYRVVLAGLRADDIPAVAQILGNAGFREVMVRKETGH